MLQTAPTDPPTLYYSGTCPLCRNLSRLVVALSLHKVRRVPMSYDEAVAFYTANPQYANMLVLFHDRGVTVGVRVFLAVPWLVARTWWRTAWSRLHAGRGCEGRT